MGDHKRRRRLQESAIISPSTAVDIACQTLRRAYIAGGQFTCIVPSVSSASSLPCISRQGSFGTLPPAAL